MFAKTIVDSDAFLDMPATAQLLYFHLAMRADDDGFVNKPKAVMRLCGARDDDAKTLIEKGHLLETVEAEAGFHDYSGFYRAFRQEYGISPRQYRSLQEGNRS